jgi:hypothetical protein
LRIRVAFSNEHAVRQPHPAVGGAALTNEAPRLLAPVVTLVPDIDPGDISVA